MSLDIMVDGVTIYDRSRSRCRNGEVPLQAHPLCDQPLDMEPVSVVRDPVCHSRGAKTSLSTSRGSKATTPPVRAVEVARRPPDVLPLACTTSIHFTHALHEKRSIGVH